MRFIICLLIFTISSISLAQNKNNSTTKGPYNQLIIRGATLINGNGAPPISPVDITVENDRITGISVIGYPGVPIDENERPKLRVGGKEINATGMYVLPGFIDMHGHIGGISQGADWEYVFKLWLAHGVTTVREPSGRGVEYAVDLKKRSAKNEIIAPRILAYTGFGQGSKKPINSQEQAREWVRQNAKNGADGIKFFGAEPHIMTAALDENKKLGLRSACFQSFPASPKRCCSF